VFVLFFVLLALGYTQTKDRRVSRGRVSILPVAMLALSCFGVVSAFGPGAAPLTAWIIGIGVAAALALLARWPQGVSFSAEANSYLVPGSWIPLLLMMLIFFTKYAVAVVVARKLAIAARPLFVPGVALCYGFFSGLFVGRAAVIWRSNGDGKELSK
jgi:hypothetical protein